MKNKKRFNTSLTKAMRRLNGPGHMYYENGVLVIEPVTQAEYDRVVKKIKSSQTLQKQ